MDQRGSVVRDSFTMRSSYIFNTNNANTNKSFISTAIGAEGMGYGDELRKSRIQNLPNHRKINLGDNLQFIVVFQTIEIERLSQEVEVLRMRLKESERQLFNAQNYEVQIRELTEKCFGQEKDIAEYREEYEKLNKICETLYHENEMLNGKLKDMDFSLKQKFETERSRNAELQMEIDRWKMRVQASENTRAKELEDLRNTIEAQRKSTINREIKEMTVRFESERANWENDLRKTREMLENRNRQISDLKQKCQKYEITITELRNYENVIADAESKNMLLSQQLARLNQILRERQEDIHSFRMKEQKLSQQVKEQSQWEYASKQLQASFDSKVKEVEEWRLRASRLEDQVVRSRELTHYNEELGNKLNLAMGEIERLNKILKTKLQEIEQWKRKINEKELQISKYKNLENDIHNYESKITNAKIENDRINGILKSRLAEIEDWKSRYNALQATVNGFSAIEKDKRIADEKLNAQIRITEELRFSFQKLEAEIANYRKNQSSYKDIERNNIGLNNEIQRLNAALKNSTGELTNMKTKASKLDSKLEEYKTIEGRLADYQAKIKQLTKELEKLNDLLKDRNSEITALDKEKIQMLSRINHYKNYQVKITENEQVVKRLQEANATLKKEIQGWQKKHRDAEDRSRDHESNLFRVNQEKEKLNSMVKNKSSESEEMRSQLMRLEQEMRIKNELELIIEEQNNHMGAMKSDLDGYENRLRATEKEIEKERNQSNEFAYKIIVLSCEVQRLSQSGGSGGKIKQKELLELQDSYNKLQVKVTNKNAEIDSLMAKIRELDSKCEGLRKNYTNLLSEVERSHTETVQLVKKVEEYQGYATNIAILNNEIDRLTSLNKALDEDVRQMRWKYADNINDQNARENQNLHMVIMAVEIETLRRRLEERQMNEEQFRKSILEPVRRA